jgi:hypothetical protein
MRRGLFLLAMMSCACEAESAGWDGSYITLAVGQSKTTTPPAAYTAVLLDNLGNSTSTVLLTFGGAPPLPIELPPETNTPAFFIDDFSASNLNVFNESGSQIGVQLLGIGIAGERPARLDFGVKLALPPGQSAQAVSDASWMNLSFNTTTNALTTFIVFGGTTRGANPTTRAVVVQLNAAATSGPASGAPFDNNLPQPTGSSLAPSSNLVYAATMTATYNLLYDWDTSTILVANISAATAEGASITLSSLSMRRTWLACRSHAAHWK